MRPVFLPKAEFMREALCLAEEAAAAGEVPVGAVVERDGIVLGRGRNRCEEKKNGTLHAELAAIAQACEAVGDWRLTGANLYVTLEPCPMCAGAAVNSRIARVIFGAEDARLGACGSVVQVLKLPGCHQPELYRGFFELQAQALLKKFFATLRTPTKNR